MLCVLEASLVIAGQ